MTDSDEKYRSKKPPAVAAVNPAVAAVKGRMTQGRMTDGTAEIAVSIVIMDGSPTARALIEATAIEIPDLAVTAILEPVYNGASVLFGNNNNNEAKNGHVVKNNIIKKKNNN